MTYEGRFLDHNDQKINKEARNHIRNKQKSKECNVSIYKRIEKCILCNYQTLYIIQNSSLRNYLLIYGYKKIQERRISTRILVVA